MTKDIKDMFVFMIILAVIVAVGGLIGGSVASAAYIFAAVLFGFALAWSAYHEEKGESWHRGYQQGYKESKEGKENRSDQYKKIQLEKKI